MIAHIDLNNVVIGHQIARRVRRGCRGCQTGHERERWGYCAGFVQIALGCV